MLRKSAFSNGLDLERLRQSVEERFGSSPLEAVGKELSNLLRGAFSASLTGTDKEKNEKKAAAYVIQALKRLPCDFGDRFVFDIFVIKAITQEWNRKYPLLSNAVVASYQKDEWAHWPFALPSSDGSSHVLDVIFIPGGPQLSGISLVFYVLLVHELSHAVLRHFGPALLGRFELDVAKAVRDLRLRAIPDGNAQKQRAEKMIADFEKHWRPTVDQQNWTYELAADLLSLWAIGPAYVEAIQHELMTNGKNPFHIEPSYPPYAVRLSALRYGLRELRWMDEERSLAVFLDELPSSQWGGDYSNHFRFVAEESLIRSTSSYCLSIAEELGIPKCTPELIASVNKKLETETPLEMGIELLIGTWLKGREVPERYRLWETSTINSLLS